jgi:hypothetical protein
VTLLTLYLIGALGAALLALWRLPRIPRRWPLLVIAAMPQLGAILGAHIPGMFLVSVLALVAWYLHNHAVAGVPLVAMGGLLNLLVMAFHGGAMPIGHATLAAIGRTATPGTMLAGSKDIVASSPLWLLSDWLIVSVGGLTVVASPGDLLVVAGVAWWLLYSRPPKEEQSNADAVRHPGLA